MTDYLEELLSRLSWPREEEQETQWQAPTAGLLSAWRWDEPQGPQPDTAGALDGSGPSRLPVLEKNDALSGGWLMEKETLSLGTGEGNTPAPDEGESPWEKTGSEDVTGEDHAGAQSGTHEESGAVRAAQAHQILSRRRPALLENTLQLEQAASRAGALIAQRLSGARSVSLTAPGRAGALGQEVLNRERAGSGMESMGAGEVRSHTDQARLVDRAFQMDSRRYDRGFSLY